MTAVALPATGPLTGAGTLLRFVLRRDRRRLLIWVLALAGTTVYATTALGAVYPTAADRLARAAVIDTPAGILFSGPGYGIDTGYPLGAMIANEMSLAVMVAVAIMSIQLVVRHTRAEEEDGAAELLLAAPVGRRAPLMTALSLVALADLAVAVVVVAALVGSGLAVVDSVALAVGWALTGLVFGAVAAVTAQLFEQARGATGSALAVLGIAVIVRGIGDIQVSHGGALSWFSPIAWAQQTRPFVDLRWWPLLLSLVLTALLTLGAFALGSRRDVGAGLLAPNRGPATASAWLAGPIGLLTRLQRGTVTGWAVALLLLGATFGSLSDAVLDMVAENPLLAEAFAATGGTLSDSFTAASGIYFGLCVAGFAVASVLRVRGEETAGRAELMLATPLDRRRLLGSGLVVTTGAALLLLVAAGLGAGLTAASVVGDSGMVGRQLGAALVQLPAVLVVAGVAALLVGAAPRFAALAWLVLVYALLTGMFGALLGLPDWLLKLSPFGWVPRVPAEDAALGPLIGLTVVAAALFVGALAAFRRRDVPA